jgi:hypothetical protein
MWILCADKLWAQHVNNTCEIGSGMGQEGRGIDSRWGLFLDFSVT